MVLFERPFISVIVPVYNSEPFIDKTIRSILGQTFVNFELLLIDDGSRDQSVDICNKYAEIDNRITIVRKKNEGVSVARNVGLDIAKGQYVIFIDSDDWIDPEFINTYV
ncbi:glycosyltransferase, partial [Pseudoxanthomonas sp. SGD-10]